MRGYKIKPLIWKDQSLSYLIFASVSVCVCVIRHRSVSVAPSSPRSPDIHTLFTSNTFTHSLSLMHNPAAHPEIQVLCTHTRYSFTKTCRSAPHTESPLRQCDPINPPYYVTIHMHAQKQTAAEQRRSIHVLQPSLMLTQHEFCISR